MVRIVWRNWPIGNSNFDASKILISGGEESGSNTEWKTFHIEMLRKVAKAAEDLQSSNNTSLDLDYPWVYCTNFKSKTDALCSISYTSFFRPVTLVKRSFVQSDSTKISNQLPVVDPVDQVDGTANFGNSIPKYYNEETFSSPIMKFSDGPGSRSTASLHSIDTAVTAPAVSPKMLRCVYTWIFQFSVSIKYGALNDLFEWRSVEDLNSRPSSRASITTAETVSLADSTARYTSSPMRHLGEKKTGKPPNIIVFSESPSSVDNIKASLNYILRKHR